MLNRNKATILLITLLIFVYYLISFKSTPNLAIKSLDYSYTNLISNSAQSYSYNSDVWIVIQNKGGYNSNQNLKNLTLLYQKHNILVINHKLKSAFIIGNHSLADALSFNLKQVDINFLLKTLIKFGAKYVYETDASLIPKSLTRSSISETFNLKQHENGIAYNCQADDSINILAHFGQPTLCQRGCPCDTRSNSTNNKYICGPRKTSIIQHALIDFYPDVEISQPIGLVKFDESAPSVQMPNYKLSAYSSLNTFYHYEALWSLYLPTSVEKNADIVRSYWAQRLLWLLNETVSFHPPNSHRISHKYNTKNKNEISFKRLIDFLFKWRCIKTKFFDCVLDLSSAMAANKHWNAKEADSIQNWLADLTSSGYKEPLIVNFENSTTQLKAKCETTHPSGFHKYELVYIPNLDNSAQISNSLKYTQSFSFLEQFCNASQVKLDFKPKSSKSEHKYPDVMLIISFNYVPLVDNLVLLKHIYYNYFKNIIICGPGILVSLVLLELGLAGGSLDLIESE